MERMMSKSSRYDKDIFRLRYAGIVYHTQNQIATGYFIFCFFGGNFSFIFPSAQKSGKLPFPNAAVSKFFTNLKLNSTAELICAISYGTKKAGNAHSITDCFAHLHRYLYRFAQPIVFFVISKQHETFQKEKRQITAVFGDVLFILLCRVFWARWKRRQCLP